MNHLARPLDRSLRLGAVIAFTALMMAVPASLAQTPESGTGMEGPHPAHIHAGTCAELGDVVKPLTDVASPEGEQVGATAAHAVKTSTTHVDMPIEDLLAAPYAVNVHQSAENIDVYIACGDIGGTLVIDEEDGDKEVRFGLTEMNGSGFNGTVTLGQEGDGETEVVVILTEPDASS